MTFVTDVEHWFTETETEVLNIVVKIKQGVAVLETDIQAALNWIARNAPQIEADLGIAVQAAAALGAAGITISPAIITAVNASAAAINAVAASQNSGAATATTLVAGYTAYTQADTAATQARAAIASAAVSTS